jgi:hypothetical protein
LAIKIGEWIYIIPPYSKYFIGEGCFLADLMRVRDKWKVIFLVQASPKSSPKERTMNPN